MSVSNVKAFFDKIEESKSLQAKLKASYKEAVKKSRKDSTSALVKIASVAGFKFTAKDLAKARKTKAIEAPASLMAGADVSGQSYNSCGSYWCDVGWTYYGQP
jgi:predicted ribosomally synthesized peptide with nif11-like leader